MERDDLSDPSDWKATSLPGLYALDSTLRCLICKDFYTAPVITTCLHTFCSICIRRSLSGEAVCPACRTTNISDSGLRQNKVVEDLVENFLAVRPENRQDRREGAKTTGTAQQAPEQDGVEVSALSLPPRPTTRATTIMAQQPKQPKCPICCRQFKSEAAIDRHIDSCTGPETSIPNNNSDGAIVLSHTQTNPPRKTLPSSSNGSSNTFTPLPKINYTLYSEAKLRSVLSTLSLPTHGNKALLSARHKEYVNLYNANIDRRNPLSQQALLKQIREWEVVQARLSGGASGEGKRKEIDGVEWGRRFEGDFADLARRARESTKRQKMDHQDGGEGESVGRENGQKGGDG